MQHHRQEFLERAVQREALRFGSFTLKSGRISPYFFNAGRLCHGSDLASLARGYRAALGTAGIAFDMVFGPAYKGIPLAAALAIECDVPYAFDRKEAKDHGEGGTLIGAPLAGRVLIVDDVITAGTAIRLSIDKVRAQGAEVAGIAVALDRQERGPNRLSAVQEVESDYSLRVVSIASLSDLIELVGTNPALHQHAAAMQAYGERYGVALAPSGQ